MTKETFNDLIRTLTGNELYQFITQFSKPRKEIDCYLKQLDPLCHDIHDRTKRKDKEVIKTTGRVDETGKDITTTEMQPVARIAISTQQDVTDNAAGILCGNKIELIGEDASVQDIWDGNKLDYKTLRICSIWLSETEVAELWYKNEDGEYKSMVLANSEGDRMYPVFDNLGKMICFGRSYVAQDYNTTTQELEDINQVEIYTEKEVIKGNDQTGSFVFENPILHGFEKIPVSYCSRKYPIWHPVQKAIERTEESISNLCDTNDYFGSPILFAEGGIISFADKGERGKLVEGEVGAKLQYVTWDQAPESVQLELKLLEKIVTDATKYINLSIDNLKGLFGSAPSAYAIKLLFMPAHQQAAKHEEVFADFILRRLNILLSATGGAPDTITPKFTYLLPKNEAEEVQTINTAKAGGFLSTETAVRLSPTTGDAEEEIQLVQGEADNKAAQAALIAKQQTLIPAQ